MSHRGGLFYKKNPETEHPLYGHECQSNLSGKPVRAGGERAAERIQLSDFPGGGW